MNQINQRPGNYYGGGYRPPRNKGNQNVALWICVGLLCVVLIGGALFVGVFMLRNRQHVRPVQSSVTAPASTETPQVTPPPTAEPTPGPTVSGGSYYYPSQNQSGVYFVNAFTNSGIYVRKEASKQSAKLLYIAQGDTNVRLRYLGETVSYDPVENISYVWYQVETPNGMVGYVRSDVVRQW